MTVYEAISQLLQIQEKRTEKIFTSDLMIVGCARLGSDNFTIKYGKVQELQNNDFGKPLHCLIVPGKLHFMEEDMLGLWK